MNKRNFSIRFKQMISESGHANDKQHELAAWLGISQPLVNYYLNGQRLPAMDSAIELATKLGCTVEWLLTGRGSKYPFSPTLDMVDISALSTEEKSNFKALVNSIIKSKTAAKAANGN